MKTAIWLLVIVVAGLSQRVEARTWRVEKDGSGDHTVIQDALDAAASGDTIRIGPGRFDDFREYGTNGGPTSVIAMIQVPVITLIGAGASQTIVGPTIYNWDDSQPVPLGVLCIAQPTDGEVNIIGTSFEHLHTCVYVENAGNLNVRECSFMGSGDYGVDAFVSSTITDCQVSGYTWGIASKSPADSCIVADTVFDYNANTEGVLFMNTARGVVRNCTFTATSAVNAIGVVFYWSGGGVYDSEFRGLAQALVCTSARYPDILRNFIDTYGYCIASDSEALTLRDNVLRSTGSWSTIRMYTRGLDHEFTRNHILRGSGLAVEIINHTGPENYHLDMTGNWWGTTDRDSISAWIHDGNDVTWPPGGLVECTVDFEPFAEEPVPTEQKSLGGLKSLFLGR